MKNSRIVTLATFATIVFGGVETAFAGTLYTFTTIDVPGAIATSASGINDSVRIVGSCYCGFCARYHGFLATPVATPVPEPATWLLFGSGLVGLMWVNRALSR